MGVDLSVLFREERGTERKTCYQYPRRNLVSCEAVGISSSPLPKSSGGESERHQEMMMMMMEVNTVIGNIVEGGGN